MVQAEGSKYHASRAAYEPWTPRSKYKSSFLLVTDDLDAEYLTRSSNPYWILTGREVEVGYALGELSCWDQLRHEVLEQEARAVHNLEALLFIWVNQEAKKQDAQKAGSFSWL